ncbi:BhlA holin family protein [Clostridium acidisoli DSM 12555]|uniref:BhlA holin family protein n=1 Tax=Clostridium acidisoli DSM 12555 TaxID=1121291 RepID=A0A1W1XS82_9CLOT|nr:BhlA/UviB family holin-like peptide [Clostridium acidisoli]SMC26830.1 BhlA holin family protein [Clostridium acidisoli DSM 12555]
MENEVFKMAMQQGMWAALFVVLLFYILKKQEQRDKMAEEREKKYQEIINKLTEKFSILEDVKKDIEEVKAKIFK